MAKVLSIKQPYAQLCVLGAKKIETKPMRTKYRGELLIHASQDFNRYLRDLVHRHPFNQYLTSHLSLPTGAIIGKVDLVDVQPVEKIKHNLFEIERAFGDYTDGRYGWILENPVLFDTPIPAKGQLGIWNYDLKYMAHV